MCLSKQIILFEGYKIDLSDYDLDENDLDFIKELIFGNNRFRHLHGIFSIVLSRSIR